MLPKVINFTAIHCQYGMQMIKIYSGAACQKIAKAMQYDHDWLTD